MRLIHIIPQLVAFAAAQSTNPTLRTDNGTYGPALEEYHYYYQQWPIGLAISSTGRFFASYTRGNYTFTLGEATNLTHEVPYPSQDLQLPVSDLNTTLGGIPFGSSNSSAFISVQALYITPQSNTTGRPETLWVLDTGRPTVHAADGTSSMPYAQPGGPKLVAISLANNSIYQTYTFPPDVHYPTSYLNDLRFDLRPQYTNTTAGVAYLVDSSDNGTPGFIVLDLGTGQSWRRLSLDYSVLRGQQDVPSYHGQPFYLRQPGHPIGWQQEGLDGTQLSPDGSRMYYSPLTSKYLYSIPTANLRQTDANPLAEVWAHANVTNHGQRGGDANGFEGDSNGLVYQLIPEQNAVYYFDPADGLTKPLLRDPRILWPDGASVGQDGYIYLNINQLFYQPDWNDGVDGRVFPGAVLRAKLPNNGTKITTLY